MSDTIHSVAEYLTREGWEFNCSEEDGSIEMQVPTPAGHWVFIVRVSQDGKTVFFHSVCPLRAPVEYRPKVAEFLMRVNRGVYIGGFVMDFDSGEIRYETYMQADEYVDPAATELPSVDNNLATMNKYLLGIARVIASDVTPAEALTEVVTGVRVDKKYIYN
jgi:hypothetical protein